MGKYASEIIKLAQSWIWKNEFDGSHKEIIDIYNSHKPLARGYKVKYNDPWCATFISALSIKLNYTDIIPTECGCQEMIALFKKLGCWVENDAYRPNPGDIIFYDWQDNGKGDNVGYSDHVGLCEKVVGNTIVVIEGNIADSVNRREIVINGKNIRGYGVPKYDAEPKPSKFNQKVCDWQKAAILDGFVFPKYGADGEWGTECEAVAKACIVKKRVGTYKYRNTTKIVQRAVGVKVDGKCGNDTRNAIIVYQKKNGLVADGEVGIDTWKKILGV